MTGAPIIWTDHLCADWRHRTKSGAPGSGSELEVAADGRSQTTTKRNTPHAKQHLTEGISADPILFDLPPRHRTCRALRCRCSSRSSDRSTSAARISTSLWTRRRPKAIASNGTRGAALRNSWVTMAQPGETAVAIASIKMSMLPAVECGKPAGLHECPGIGGTSAVAARQAAREVLT
jgi:hypothetical protein